MYYSVEDFIKKEDDNNFTNYTLKNDCKIFEKTLETDCFCLTIHKSQSLANFINKINDYIIWLNGNMTELISSVYGMHSILLIINEAGGIEADIKYFLDNKGKIYYIKLVEKEVKSKGHNGYYFND